jgi:hypothetical protein
MMESKFDSRGVLLGRLPPKPLIMADSPRVLAGQAGRSTSPAHRGLVMWITMWKSGWLGPWGCSFSLIRLRRQKIGQLFVHANQALARR